MKKFLTIILAVSLLLCLMPSTAFASDELRVVLTENSSIYDGTAKGIVSTVTNSGGAVTNYTTQYYKVESGTETSLSSAPSDVGSYKVKVISGNEDGVADFTIIAKDLTTSASIGGIISSGYEYTGREIKPSISVSSGGRDLTSNDYNPTYSGNINPGASALITVTGKDNYTGATSTNFTINKLDLNNAIVSIPDQESTTSANLDIKVMTAAGVEITKGIDYTVDVAYTSPNATATATISAVSTSNLVKAGTQKTQVYNVVNTVTPWSINPTSIGNQVYTGKAITPAIRVYYGYTTLTNDRDYNITYNNNIAVGQATVTIKAKGSYSGTKVLKFNITQRDIANTTIQVDNAVYASGNTVTPNISIKNGDITLIKGQDYTVSSSSSAIGTGTVRITGINNYMGSTDRNFQIVDGSKNLDTASLTIGNVASSSIYSCYYNGTAQTPSVKVELNGTTIGSNNYNVTYENNTNSGYATVIVTGKNEYAGRKTAVFQIKRTPMNAYNTTVSGYSGSYAYTGIAITPTISVVIGGRTLKKDVDYTITYENNRAVSTSTVKGKIIVTGIGGYEGSKTVEFVILGKSITSCITSFADGRTSSSYSGAGITPKVVVRDGYLILNEGTDYTLSYTDPAKKTVYSLKESGVYSVIITGKGNYSGQTTLTYTIVGSDISRYTVTLSNSQVVADGTYKYPIITSVAYGATSKLLSSDYTVTYQDSTGKTVTSMSAPGVYKVVVTGKNGYSGSTYATFTIKGLPQTVTAAESSYKVYPTTETFKIPASATGDGTGFTYTSSNPTVASVSALGYVTMHKMGRAVITISTTGTKKYDPASDTVVIKVYPRKSTITQKPWTSGKKAQFKVRWTKQEDATRYEVRYSRNKSFKKGTYITKKVTPSTLAYTTQSTTIKNLKRGYTYYVKVRAVKEVYNDYGQKLTYYGSWSGWRSVRTK